MSRWTEEEIKQLKTMFEDGYEYSKISKELNRTLSSIANKLNKLKLKKEDRTTSYLYEIGDILKGVKIIEKTRVKNGNSTRRGYLVKSLAYPNDKNDYKISEDSLKRMNIDLYFNGKVCEENSLYSCTPIRGNIIDIEKAKRTSLNSNTPIYFKCDNKNCKHIKKMYPYSLTKNGFSCNICSKHIPYGQLAFGQYQEYFKLNYKSERVLKTLDDRRVDFVKFNNDNTINHIVEIQGEQHTNKNHIWYEDSYEQDIAKRKWAKENNILMIEIDMRISSWEYFRKQINNCGHLPSINDEDEKIILELMEKNKRYPIAEITELYQNGYSSVFIGKKYKMSYQTVLNILRKNNIKIVDVNTERSVNIKCVTTGEIFNSISKASEVREVSRANIRKNLNGKRKSAGKHPITGEKLQWEYVD